jgi:hypothetical protein
MNKPRKEHLRRTYMEITSEVLESYYGKKLKSTLKEAKKIDVPFPDKHTTYQYAAAKLSGLNIVDGDDQHAFYATHPNLSDQQIGDIVNFVGMDLMLYDLFMENSKVFRFREALTLKLLETNIQKVDSFFLKLPFESIIISLEQPIAMVNPQSNQKGEIFNEIYLHIETIESEGKEFKTLYMIAIDNTGVFDHGHDNVLIMVETIGEGDILSQLSNMSKNEYSHRKAYALNELVMSMLLYLNSSDPDINPVLPQKSPYEKLLRAKGRGTSSLEHLSVGDSITIDRNWNQPTETEGIKGENKRITPTWIVRGHFRNQAHGKNFQERKITWIEPYVKGDMSKEIHGKSYDAKYEN